MQKYLVVLAAAFALALVTSVGAQQPQSAPLLQQSDFTYLGAFRLPARGVLQEQDWAYGGTGVAVNPTSGSLFMIGHQWYKWIGELGVPTPVNAVSLNQLNTASIIQPMAPGRANEFSVLNFLGNLDIGGMLVLNGELFLTAFATYDGNGAQAQSHFRRASTNLSQSVALQGPVALANIGTGFVSGYITPIPTAWQTLLGGKALSGQCCISIISRTSWGPSATAFDPANIGVVTPVPATPLLAYPQSNPTLGGYDTSFALFNGAVRMAGAIFPAGGRSVLFFGRVGLGPYCYGPGTGNLALVGTFPPGDGIDAYCYDPTDASKGTHGYPYGHQVWAYDANELLAVRNGTRQRWEVLPYATWNFDLPFQSASRLIMSVAYDPNINRMYVVSAYNDGEKPLVHVFSVNTSPVTAVNVSSANRTIGSQVTATVTLGPANVSDWLGLFPASALSSSPPVDWKYLSGTQVQPGIGLATASVPFTMPAPPGPYNVRLFAGASTLLATSPTITVTSTATVSVSPISSNGGGTVTASVATGPGNPTDWLGLFPVGANASAYLARKYLNGSQTTAPVSGLTSASVPFTLPMTFGQYEVRLYINDTTTLFATSPTVTVAAPSVTPEHSLANIGQPISATVSAGPANAADWVGLFAVGSPNTIAARLDWKYLDGTQTVPVSGLSSAVVPFVALGPAAQYEFRLFSNNTTTLIATSSPFSALGSGASVLVSATTAPGGSSITASITSGPGNPGDWVGLYSVSEPSSGAWVSWNYLNGTRTQPGAGLTSANMPFVMPATPGQYQLRLFANNSLTLLATSLTINVAGTTVEVSPTAGAGGTAVTASVTNGLGGAADWVGLYPVNDASPGSWLDWKYLNASRTPPGTGSTSANLPFTMPTTPGQYHVRFYASGSANVVATSATINVTGVGLGVSPTLGTAGTVVTAAITNGPGNTADWVGLYPVGNSDPGAFVDWNYLNGSKTPPGVAITSANLQFTLPATAGQYHVRFFQNGSGTVLATSAAVRDIGVSVSPTSGSGGTSVTATIASGPGNAADWVGLYPVNNASAGAFVDWKYLNGTRTAPGTGLTSASLQFTLPGTSGQYHVRFFQNGSGTVVATSPAITVNSVGIGLSATSGTGGNVVTAAITSGPGNIADWVGLYPLNDPNPGAYIAWQYLNGNQTPPVSGITAANLPFTLPSTPGPYQVRFFQNGSATVLATSATITVAAAANVGVSPTSGPGGTIVTAAITAGPGNTADWVGLYPVGNADPGAFVDWMYLNGTKTAPGSGITAANLPFTMPGTPGPYHIRLFQNGSATVIATSATITAQ